MRGDTTSGASWRSARTPRRRSVGTMLYCAAILYYGATCMVAATCGAVLQQVAASCATLPCRDDSVLCIPDRAFEPLRPPDRAWAHECLARGAHVVWNGEARLARVRQGAGRAAVCVCCAATVLSAALAWPGLSMAAVHVCRTVLVSFRIVYVGTVVCAGFTHCTRMAPPRDSSRSARCRGSTS